MHDLIIARPITIKGKPGTILEITHGSIVVDFEYGFSADNTERFKEVLNICECHIVFSDRANQILIQEEIDKDYEH